MSLSKIQILQLICNNSERIQFVKFSLFTFYNQDLFQMCLDGNLLRNFVYCKKCAIILKQHPQGTGNLYTHCRTAKHSGTIRSTKDFVLNSIISSTQFGRNEDLIAGEESFTWNEDTSD